MYLLLFPPEWEYDYNMYYYYDMPVRPLGPLLGIRGCYQIVLGCFFSLCLLPFFLPPLFIFRRFPWPGRLVYYTVVVFAGVACVGVVVNVSQWFVFILSST